MKTKKYEIQTKTGNNWETLCTHGSYDSIEAAEQDVEWFMSGAGCHDPRDAQDWENGEYRIREINY